MTVVQIDKSEDANLADSDSFADSELARLDLDKARGGQHAACCIPLLFPCKPEKFRCKSREQRKKFRCFRLQSQAVK